MDRYLLYLTEIYADNASVPNWIGRRRITGHGEQMRPVFEKLQDTLDKLCIEYRVVEINKVAYISKKAGD
jgi:hypothetical protein